MRGVEESRCGAASLRTKGVGTSTTILRNAPKGGPNKRDGVDPVHDANLLVAHLDLLHQGSDDFPTGGPVGLFQALIHPPGEFLHLTDHQAQLGALPFLLRRLFLLRFQSP